MKLELIFSRKREALSTAAAAIVAVAVTDWVVHPNASLGFLYIFPILLAAGFLKHWQIVMLALVCAALRETFAPSAWDEGFAARMVMVEGAFVASALFVKQLVRNRQLAIEHSRKLARQVRLRRQAERQLRALVDSNPAAILAVNGEGLILMANAAAGQLFESETLEGEPVTNFLPALAHVPYAKETEERFQTTMECTGQTKTGSPFLAQVCFSTYVTETGPQLAAIVLDSSEDLRNREGFGLLSLMNSSRVLVVAMMHEVRNLSVAARVALANLEQQPGIKENKDFQALGSLVGGLAALSSSDLRRSSNQRQTYADLVDVLHELRIVIEPSCAEAKTDVRWDLPQQLPPVRCDHHSLLQVFLNLAQNSLRAMRACPRKQLVISAKWERNGIAVRLRDTGQGVPVPERLFQPFQPGSDGTGLGLYVSRTIMRSFAGDLYYESQPLGSCFVVQLATRKRELNNR